MQTYMKDIWSLNAISNEAKKYNTLGEFEAGNSNAYRIAWSNGILGDICKHMDISRRVSYLHKHPSHRVRYLGHNINKRK